ncbi:MAG: histone deacetylase [Alphaproteobacteria bacterium]|nr:histone deacetylase [Alphaproteobacteria bacterium]
MAQVFFPDTGDIPLTPGHTFPAEKYRLLREAVAREKIVPEGLLAAAPRICVEDLRRVHCPAYVGAVLNRTLDGCAVRKLGLPLSDTLVARSLVSVGGSLAAARAALATGIASNLSGGTHHAHRDFGSGYCVFNDAAVVSRVLLDEAAVARIAILDCDVHQGDGTAALMAAEPRVLTVDLYGGKNFPARKVPPDVAFPLPDATGDAVYLETLDEALAAIAGFRPGLLIYNAGVDPLHEDRLGRLSLSLAGLHERDRRVFAFARKHSMPVASVLGGGYAQPISLTVAAYANTLRAARQAFAS